MGAKPFLGIRINPYTPTFINPYNPSLFICINPYTPSFFPSSNPFLSVPNPPTGLTAVVTGTASIMLQWDQPRPHLVRGNDTIYYIIFQNGNMTSNVPMLNLINSSLILRGAIQTIQVKYLSVSSDTCIGQVK